MQNNLKNYKGVEIDTRELQKAVYLALDLFLAHHRPLLTSTIGKGALTHKIAEALQTLFPTHYVDCAYPIADVSNLIQIVKMRQGLSTTEQERTILYPDIVVHSRNAIQPLLILEIQPSFGATHPLKRFSEKKVEAYLKLKYAHVGLNLLLNTDESLQQPYVATWHLPLTGMNP